MSHPNQKDGFHYFEGTRSFAENINSGRAKIAIYHCVIMPGLLLLPCWPGPLHSPCCTSVKFQSPMATSSIFNTEIGTVARNDFLPVHRVSEVSADVISSLDFMYFESVTHSSNLKHTKGSPG